MPTRPINGRTTPPATARQLLRRYRQLQPPLQEADDTEDETYGDAHITLLARNSDNEFDRGSNDQDPANWYDYSRSSDDFNDYEEDSVVASGASAPSVPSIHSHPSAPSAPVTTIIHRALPRHNSDEHSSIHGRPVSSHTTPTVKPADPPAGPPKEPQEVDQPNEGRVVVIRTTSTTGLRPPRIGRARLPHSSMITGRNPDPNATTTPSSIPANTGELPPGPSRHTPIPTLPPRFRTK
jgi:hypothetical protein